MRRSSTKSLSISKTKQDKKEENSSVSTSNAMTTPVAIRKSIPEEEYSPIQICFTQDGGDDELDVVWDWNSPQSRVKKTYNKQRKRPPSHQSPQIPRKLHSKNNLIPKFTSLKAELEKLNRHQNEKVNHDNINLDDNLLINLSPILTRNTKETSPKNVITEKLEWSSLEDDLFDEEMFKCSQQVEATIAKPQVRNIEKLINTHSATNITFDDSFDAMITEFTEDDIARLSQENEKTPTKNPSRTIYRTNSTPVRSERVDSLPKNNCSTPLRSNKFPRTKSADDFSKLPRSKSPVLTCSPDEIEKKRLEAKARLELRKTQQEIEKKRLEALEKLKKNRLQRNASSRY